MISWYTYIMKEKACCQTKLCGPFLLEILSCSIFGYMYPDFCKVFLVSVDKRFTSLTYRISTKLARGFYFYLSVFWAAYIRGRPILEGGLYFFLFHTNLENTIFCFKYFKNCVIFNEIYIKIHWFFLTIWSKILYFSRFVWNRKI